MTLNLEQLLDDLSLSKSEKEERDVSGSTKVENPEGSRSHGPS